MNKRIIETEVLVIGGGATGTGILRDAAMRGFDTILVEARDLTHGTTGRFHGLLHSGGRYVVKDSQAAKECIEENRILRKIMPRCIEDVGGFFVETPWDEPGYADSFLAGCQIAGVPVEEVPIAQMLNEEPLLNPQISRCFRVPDGAADAFAAAHANVASATEYGAKVFNYHEVTRLLTSDRGPSSAVIGAHCHDVVNDQHITIHADLVINAAGAWVGKIGATAGVEIAIRPGKGTMIAVSQRVVNTVINRCKMPSDGDILVPAHTVAVMGTTDEQIPDPDSFGIEPWEVQLMLDEGEKIIPGFKEMRMLRAWAGVRPLYQETKASDSRGITRSFVLLDHEERDGVSGLVTITSGKWTTYRKMAEATVDLVCEKLGTDRECKTHLEELPGMVTGHRSMVSKHHYLGERLDHIEKDKAFGQLICECELATKNDIEQAILEEDAKTLDDIRRDVRLGMGPCQGGFCTSRAAGILHQQTANPDLWGVEDTNVSLRDFLEERWKGLLPVLWGKQLHQERMNELIYINVLNVDHLPGPKASRLAAQSYTLTPTYPSHLPPSQNRESRRVAPDRAGGRGEGTIIIGAGLAGLTAAWQASRKGIPTKVVTKGWGATHWASGCIDVLGYHPISAQEPLPNPLAGIQKLVTENPAHPFAQIGVEHLTQALAAFQSLCQKSGYPLHGSLEQNWLLPTAVGAARPTCLAPETMLSGDLMSDDPMLLVGFGGYHDFYPHYAAANLEAQGFIASAVNIDLPSLRSRRRVDSMILAHLFDQEDFRAEVVEAITPHLREQARIGLPAVLGLNNSFEVQRDLESRLGRKVFEMPGLPPSIPGIRLHNLLVSEIQNQGGRVENGMEVLAFNAEPDTESSTITAIWTEAAARRTPHRAQQFILATGGFLGDGFKVYYNDYAQEKIFDLVLDETLHQRDWFQPSFFPKEGQPLFKAGIRVNEDFRPIDQNDKIIFENLAVIGACLGSSDLIWERSLEGVALASGYLAGMREAGQ